MENRTDKNLKWFHYSMLLIAISLLSLYFTNMHFILCNEAKRASLSLLLENSADVPTQYRVLMPWIVSFLLKLKLPFLASPVRLFKIMEFLSTFFLFVAFRAYISFFIKSNLLASLFSFTLFIILPYQYIFYSWSLGAIYYPYDIPSVLFFTLGLILIYKKNWYIYYPVFIIATFNRETTIFLTFIYLATTIEKNKIIPVLSHCISQLIIWLIIKKCLAVLYAGNSGPGFFVNFFFVNWALIIKPVNALRIAGSFGFIWIAVICYSKLITDEFVKRSLIVVFPFFVGMFIVGNVTELRIYGEIIPVILSAFLIIVNNLLRSELEQSHINRGPAKERSK
jgi:hypothetical protein